MWESSTKVLALEKCGIIILNRGTEVSRFCFLGGAMGLHWNAGHLAVYNLIQGGAANKELRAKDYKKSLIDIVATLIGAVPLGFTKE